MAELQATITESILQFDNVALIRYFKENKSYGSIELIFVDGKITEITPSIKHRFDFKKAELPRTSGVIDTR